MKKLRSQSLIFSLFFFSFLASLFGCAIWRQSSPGEQNLTKITSHHPWQAREKKSKSEISILTANVENLFDTEHDSGKLDYEFLPKSLKKSDPQIMDYCQSLRGPAKSKCKNYDWSQEVLEEKIRRLRKTLTQKDPQGPDILLLQEVENIHVLRQLNRLAFPNSEYSTAVLLEGQDPRGIDPALLSRFPLAGKPQLHAFHLVDPTQDESLPILTRGLLQVPLQTPGGKLQVFVLHLPSQHHPSQVRKQALKQLTKKIQELDPGDMFLIGGDFNISSEEEVLEHFYETLSLSFLVSHLWSAPSAPGTTNYRGVWSFFDVLLFPLAQKAEKYPCKPVPGSIEVLQNLPIQKTKEGYPKHFRPKSYFGVSDHFPVRALMECRPSI